MNPAATAPLPRLTRWFTLTGALMITLFSVGMALLLSGFLSARLLTHDAELSRDFLQSMVDNRQAATVFRRGEVAGNTAFIDFFAQLALMPDVLRANVYTPARKVLWSSRPEIIGLTFPRNDELDEALDGEVVAHVDDNPGPDTKAEHVLLALRPSEFVENYLPVIDRASGELLGVVELYRRPVALLDAIRSGQQRVWLGALVGGVVLFLSLGWFVRRIERSLREQQSRLVEAEALAMVGELSAAVAHSIRNPLGSIRSSAELQRELGADAPVDVDDVIRQVDRIEHLVRTLLTYAREPLDAQAHCPLARALQGTRARFAPELAAQGKPFETDWPAELGEVAMDEVLLAQVLASVMANAAEATQRGQAIRLSATLEKRAVLVCVDDEGSGIAPEQLAQVAKPFFTTKPRGLGLGLSLARRAVERIGGAITVAHGPARGTRVTLRLPLRPTANDQA